MLGLNYDYDVIVAGGGPAGSCAATLLAQYGYRVLLLEKDQHPRFHIGESMLPYSELIIQRLGIDWSKNAVAKRGAVFIDEAINKSMFFQLSGKHQAYQVERASLDSELFNNAAKHGVETRQHAPVNEVVCNAQQVLVSTNQSAEISSRYFIDATGRAAILGRQQGTVERIGNLGKFALYTHFSQVNSQTAEDLFAEGNIVVPIVDIGWMWVIPLSQRRVSIGLVVAKERPANLKPAELFQHYIDQSDYLAALLAGAQQEQAIRSEANFSYTNQQRYGQRYACCGDAAGFLDPVFSSGVFLALTGAARVADRLHTALQSNNEADPQLHAMDDGDYDLGFQSMRVFVERFYQTNLVHHVFFEAEREVSIKQEISQLLAGDLWSHSNRWQRNLLRGRYAINK